MKRLKNTGIVFLLIFCVLFSFNAAKSITENRLNITAFAEETEELSEPITPSYGWYLDNIEESELEISTAEELFGFARLVTVGDDDGENITDFSDKTIILTDNIDLENKIFIPIGNSDKAFKGTFIGDGHIVSNINLTDCVFTDNFGFFGFIYESKISGLGLENVSIVMDAENNYTGVGGLIGLIENSEIDNCYVTGSVKSLNADKNGNYGGFAGTVSSSKITNCYAAVDVSGGYFSAGFAGHVKSSTSVLKGCFATGNTSGAITVGGFVADTYLSPVFEKCYFVKNDNPTGIIAPQRKDITFFYDAANFYEEGMEWDLIRFWDINADKLPTFILPSEDDGQPLVTEKGCGSGLFSANNYGIASIIILCFCVVVLISFTKKQERNK